MLAVECAHQHKQEQHLCHYHTKNSFEIDYDFAITKILITFLPYLFAFPQFSMFQIGFITHQTIPFSSFLVSWTYCVPTLEFYVCFLIVFSIFNILKIIEPKELRPLPPVPLGFMLVDNLINL